MLTRPKAVLKAAVSGSFHRHMFAIYEAVGELRARGVDVLSPADPRVVDSIGEFLFVASDKLRSIRLVQERHLQAISASDFLWVVCPDGYTGASTCMEIGAAHAANVPVFSNSPALDITIGEFVKRVQGFDEAIELTRKSLDEPSLSTALLEPELTIDSSIDALSELRPVLLGVRGDGARDAERKYDATRRTLAQTFRLFPK